MENSIVEISIYAGFMMIVIAPVFKLFVKAGEKSITALIPGVNFIKINSFLQKKISYLSVISILALSAFYFLVNIAAVNGDFSIIIFMIIQLIIVIYSLLSFYLFPMLSTTIFFYIAYLGAVVNGQLNELFLILAFILFVIGTAQAVIDFLNWKTLLGAMGKKPFYIVFPFLPAIAAFVFSVFTLFSATVWLAMPEEALAGTAPILSFDMRTLLVYFVPAFFAGIVFFYYLGYSTKTSFTPLKDQ